MKCSNAITNVWSHKIPKLLLKMFQNFHFTSQNCLLFPIKVHWMCSVYVLLFNNGFFQVDTKKRVYWSDTTNFLIDSLSYLDEVEYCLRLKARWGRPTQLWPQSDSWRTPNGLERPLCAKEFRHPILWHKREKQKSWILMNDKAIATKAALLPK